MRRRAVIASLLTAVVLAPAAAPARRSLLMPGVTYERRALFMPYGLSVVHIVTAPRPTGLYALRTALSNELVSGRETVSSVERRLAPTATTVGVNGDFFNWRDGHPTGILLRGGVLDHQPNARRSSIGVDAAGNLAVDRVPFSGGWRGVGPRRRIDAVNEPPQPGETVLFTPAWGRTTPFEPGTTEVTLLPLSPTLPNAPLTGTVAEVAAASLTPIPPGGGVLVARGAAAQTLAAEAPPVGSPLSLRLDLKPTWRGIVDALGGGPALVRGGRPIFRSLEDLTSAQLYGAEPRTAIGQRADGSLVLVVADGRRRGYSVGITNWNLAQLLVRLGVVTGSAADSGGSSTLAFEGRVLNRPSDPTGERPVAEAVLVSYAGVYAPPVAPVVSPNGDGIADSQTLAYKLVRPATVTARLVAPDGSGRTIDEGPRAPGVHTVSWSGTAASGAVEPEGRWRWSVSALDDRGQSSTADRSFALDDTLGFLAVRPRRRGVEATVTVTRPASLVARVDRPDGRIVRVLARRDAAPGVQRFRWDGRPLRSSGTFVLRVVATTELGRVELARGFVRRR